MISIHAPARGATLSQQLLGVFNSHFNPRSREGSDTEEDGFAYSFALFQSTLPRGERPAAMDVLATFKTISIHAPARGATSGRRFTDWVFDISIHAPARGATFSSSSSASSGSNFNPRSREGSDSRNRRGADAGKISIHAPARGATNNPYPLAGRRLISIHAPARGATLYMALKSSTCGVFQSTLPRGERPKPTQVQNIYRLFQSTLPRGERPCSATQISILCLFQSTLPRGERRAWAEDLHQC